MIITNKNGMNIQMSPVDLIVLNAGDPRSIKSSVLLDMLLADKLDSQFDWSDRLATLDRDELVSAVVTWQSRLKSGLELFFK